MNKKYKDMSYREFIETVLKIKLTEYQIQVLEMFEELKEKEYPLLNKKRKFCPTISEESLDLTMNRKSIADIVDIVKNKPKPTEPEMYIHKL